MVNISNLLHRTHYKGTLISETQHSGQNRWLGFSTSTEKSTVQLQIDLQIVWLGPS